MVDGPIVPKPLTDSSAINGSIVDRTIEFLNQLNQASGFSGLGTGNFTFVDFGASAPTESVLGVHNIKPEGANWQDAQNYYYQTSPQRLDYIQSQLTVNLERMQSGITDHISSLFDLLAARETDLNSYENNLDNADDYNSVINAGNQLSNRLSTTLTSDEALNTLMNAFFANFQLDIQRMQDELFGLLDDGDTNFSNSSTNAIKYFVKRPKIEGQEEQPDIVVSSEADLLQANKDLIREELLRRDASLLDPELTNTINQRINSYVQDLFQQGQLKLPDQIVTRIIASRNISQEDQDKLNSSSDFLQYISFDGLKDLIKQEYGSTLNDEQVMDKIFTKHLTKATPRYLNDQRSIKDILTGKADSNNSSNPLDRLFMSAQGQINNAMYAGTQLYQNGYERTATNELQNIIRNNPLGALEFLYAQKARTTDPKKLSEINDNIDKLSSRVQDQIRNQILLYNNNIPFLEGRINAINDELRQRPEGSVNDQDPLVVEKNRLEALLITRQAQITELNRISNISLPIREDSIAELKTTLAQHFNFTEIAATTELDSALENIDKQTGFQNNYRSLMANEGFEANQINMRYLNQKLPEARPDGTMPEDNSIIPPYVSASIYSGIIARIGNTILNKADDLMRSDAIPGANWATDNMQLLTAINDGLGDSLPGTTTTERFISHLKNSFRDIIQTFFNSNNPLKQDVDRARTDLETNHNRLVNIDTSIANAERASILNEILTGSDNRVRAQNLTLEQIATALNGNIYDSNNLIHKAGLRDIKHSLEQRINDLEHGNDDDIGDDDVISDYQLARNLLYGQGRNENNPSADSVLGLYNNFDQFVRDNIDNVDRLTEQKADLVAREGELTEDYKTKLTAYSNALTNANIDNDDDGETDIEEDFKAILDADNSFDLDGNGINDFVDISGIINNVGVLADSVRNIFGSPDTKAGGIENQDIRRLILLMFVFSMIEASDWDYKRQEAETAGYEVSA